MNGRLSQTLGDERRLIELDPKSKVNEWMNKP